MKTYRTDRPTETWFVIKVRHEYLPGSYPEFIDQTQDEREAQRRVADLDSRPWRVFYDTVEVSR